MYNHASDIDIKGFLVLPQKCTVKPYSKWYSTIFNNGIELFKKIRSGKMMLEQAKYQNEEYISRGKYISEEQKSALGNIKLAYR